jgi:protein O-GlcNAc transferase
MSMHKIKKNGKVKQSVFAITPSLDKQQKILNLYNQGLFTESVIEAEKLVACFPKFGFGWKIWAAGLQKLGKFDKALTIIKKGLDVSPNDPEVHNNLATLLIEKKDFKNAESACKKGLELNNNSAMLHYNLAISLEKQNKLNEAEQHYKQALYIQPNYSAAYANLGYLLYSECRFLEAKQTFRQALIYLPNSQIFLADFIDLRRKLCDWSGIVKEQKKLADALDSVETGVAPFQLLAFDYVTPKHLYQVGNLFAYAKYEFQLNTIPLTDNIQSTIQKIHLPHHEKIRVGYLSADFHDHATVYLIAGVLENRNKTGFDVYLYSHGIDQNSESRSRISSACEIFQNVRDLSDEEIAQQILIDEIDILVDLKGHTKNTRLGITALRPAPIIISWLGYPGTLGHERLADYIIGDATVTPLEHAEHYSETLALMPHCYQPNDNKRPIGVAPTRSEAGLPENAFIFCTFNQSYKITPSMFDIWCRLLSAIPNSILWILVPHEATQENLRREMESRGIISSRLIFAPKMGQTEHLGRLQLADLAVDTFPCTSHTTASDALWAGVPIVTKIGETFASRVAASILKTMDLAELVTTNDDDYFNVAVSMALNHEKLTSIKQKIAEQKRISPLFDTEKFARDLEQLYRTIWEQELKGERKAIISDLTNNQAKINTKETVMKTEVLKKRLNVGCGRNIMEGWLNLDFMPIEGVDIISDLDKCAEIPLPLEDNAIDEFLLSHVIEHIKSPLPLMQELWRIAKPDAQLVMKVPHGASDDAWEDPTHVRSYYTDSFGYFSQPFYWRADYGYRGDWRCDSITFVVSAQANQGLEGSEILQKINTQRNVVHEMIAQFTCIKPTRLALKELQVSPKLTIHLA